MSSEVPAPTPDAGHAVRWIVVTLSALAVLIPPETRGEALAGCAVLVALLALMSWRLVPRSGHAALLLTLLLLVPAARMSVTPGAAVHPVALSILAAAAGLAALGRGRYHGHLRAVCVTLGMVGGWVALRALYQRLWGLEHLASIARSDPDLPDRAAVLARLAGGRASAGFATPAALGGFLALTLPLVLALVIGSTGRRRAVWIAIALAETAAFLAAASATAALALLGAAGLWAVVYGLRRGREARAAAAPRPAWGRRGLWIAVLLALLAGVALQRDRIVLRPTDPAGPWRLRLGNFRAAWAMAADHPWSGVGPGAFGASYPAYRQPGDNETRHVHNLPLELAAELGWPLGASCALLWLGLFLGPLLACRPGREPLVQAAALGLAAFGLHNLADFTAFMPSILWPAALLRGLIFSAEERAEAHDSRTVWASALAAASLIVVLCAALIAIGAGLADNARWEARQAAFAGELAAALPLAERASRLAPWDIDAASLLARLTVDAVRTGVLPSEGSRLALARADDAVRISPGYPPAHEIRAAARLMIGDAAGAFADLSEAARLYPVRADYAAARDRLRGNLEGPPPAGDPR